MGINSSLSRPLSAQTMASTRWINFQRRKKMLRLFCLLTSVIPNSQSMLWNSPKTIRRLSTKSTSGSWVAKILISSCSTSMLTSSRRQILRWSYLSLKAKKLCWSYLKTLRSKEKFFLATNNMTLTLTVSLKITICPTPWLEDNSKRSPSLSSNKSQIFFKRSNKSWTNLPSIPNKLNWLVEDRESPASFSSSLQPLALNLQEPWTQVSALLEEQPYVQPCKVQFSESSSTTALTSHQLELSVSGKDKIRKCKTKEIR